MTDDPRGAVIATGVPAGTTPLSWPEVRQRLAAEKSYWLGTVGPGGHPQVRPVLAVFLADKIYSTTSPAAAKGRNLERHPWCSLAARGPEIDIVAEGAISWVDDRRLLERIASAYDSKYSWPVSITKDNMFEAPYGAPTAGSPPYRAYEITPELVYAFGTGGDLGARSTRLHFSVGD